MPLLFFASMITVYIVLGVLYESLIHPLTILSTLPSAGVGALVALWYFGYDLSLVSFIGIILLMGIVKKNAIMMVDFALDAERNEGLTPRRGHLQCVRHSVSPDYDDHHGGTSWRGSAGHRVRYRFGTAPAAWHRGGGRVAFFTGSHALYHAGRLSRL